MAGCQVTPNSRHCIGLVQVPDAFAFLRLISILDSGLRRNDVVVDSASTFIAIGHAGRADTTEDENGGGPGKGVV